MIDFATIRQRLAKQEDIDWGQFLTSLEQTLQSILRHVSNNYQYQMRRKRKQQQWKTELVEQGLFPHKSKSTKTKKSKTIRRRLKKMEMNLITHDATVHDSIDLITKHVINTMEHKVDTKEYVMMMNHKEFVREQNLMNRNLQKDPKRSAAIAYSLLRKNVSTRANAEIRRAVWFICEYVHS